MDIASSNKLELSPDQIEPIFRRFLTDNLADRYRRIFDTLGPGTWVIIATGTGPELLTATDERLFYMPLSSVKHLVDDHCYNRISETNINLISISIINFYSWISHIDNNGAFKLGTHHESYVARFDITRQR